MPFTPQQLQGLREPIAQTFHHRVVEIGSVDAPHQLDRPPQTQLNLNIGPHPGARRRGERLDRQVGELLADFSDSSVFGSKIVAPLGNTVGLIDRETRRPRRVYLRQPPKKPLGEQTFGGDEQ
jgi:hypothetical protein